MNGFLACGWEEPVEKTRRSRLISLCRVGLTLLSLVAFVCFCLSIGQQPHNPFAPYALSNPSLAMRTSAGYVFTDSQSQHLYFCDDDLRVLSVVNFNVDSSPLREATALEGDSDGNVYVLGIAQSEAREANTSESVVRYSPEGIYQENIWTFEHDDGEWQGSRILAMTPTPHGVYLAQMGEDPTYVKLVFIANGAEEPTTLRDLFVDNQLHDACYDVEADRLYGSDIYGQLYVEASDHKALERAKGAAKDALVVSLDGMGKDAIVMADGSQGNVLRVDATTGATEDIGLSCDAIHDVAFGVQTLSVVCKDGKVVLKDFDTGEVVSLRKLRLTGRLFMRNLTSTISLVYLLALVVAIFVRDYLRKRREGQDTDFTSGVVAVVSVLAVAAGIGYSVYNLFMEKAHARAQEVRTLACYLCETSPGVLLDGKDDGDTNAQMRRLSGALTALSHQASQNAIDLYSYVYATDDDGELVYALSGRGDVVRGERVTDLEVAHAEGTIRQMWKKTNGSVRQRISTVTDTVEVTVRTDANARRVYVMVPLADSAGDYVGTLEVGSSMETFLQEQSVHLFAYLLTYVVGVIGIFITIREIKIASKAYKAHCALREHGCAWSSSLLAPTMIFLLLVSGSVDAVFSVVIGRELLTMKALNEEPSMFLISLPAWASASGALLGSYFYSRRVSSKGGRAIALASIAVALLGQILCLITAQKAQFMLFVIAHLVFSAGNSTALGTAYSLVGRIDDQKYAQQVNWNCKTAPPSANVASGMLAALVVGATSAGYIYIVGICANVLAFLLFVRFMPSGVAFLEEESATSYKDMRQFFLQRKVMAVVLFAGIPFAVARGYRSLIFPLFMTSSGMSRTQMANLFVIGESVVLVLLPILNDFVKSHGKWGAATVGIFGIGATLSIMGHNQNIGWAIAAIVMVDLFCWLANRWSSMVRTWAVYEKQFSYERIEPSMTTTKQLVKSAQSPIISFFLAWGFAPGCLWLGVAAGACGLLFVLTTRRYRFYAEDRENR